MMLSLRKMYQIQRLLKIEYEEMGFKGFYSDDGGDIDELESWDGFETEEVKRVIC